MISDLDLWRAAQIMVKRYGEGAATEAAMRADSMLESDDLSVKIPSVCSNEDALVRWRPSCRSGLH